MQNTKYQGSPGELSLELRLMLACAAGDAAKSRELSAKAVDWDLFLKMALHHRVFPMVFKTLQALPGPAVPEYISADLLQKCRKNTLKAMRISGAAVQLITALGNSNIRAVMLKGPALAQRLYGNIAMRPFKDIDIFVDPAELETACGILTEQGYYMSHPKVPLTPALRRFYLKKFHHFNFRHREWNVEVELHWQLGHHGLEMPPAAAETLNTVALTGHTLPVLNDEEWFLFLVLHGASHGWFRLRWLCDIREFMKAAELDWKKIARMAGDIGARPLLDQALILVHHLFAVDVPEKHRPAWEKEEQAWRLAQMAVAFFQNAQDEPWDESRGRHWRFFWQQKRYDWQVRSNWGKKLNYVADLLGPAEVDIKRFLLPDRAYPLYYIIRPFTWLWRRIR